MPNEQEHILHRVAELESENSRLTKALQQSEEWFRKIFYASSNMMAIHTLKEGRFVDVNEAAASLGGFKREELIGYTMAERNLVDDSSFQEMVSRKLREEGRINNMECTMRGKNGEVRTVLASADTITLNNEPCLLAVSVDITEREEKADALRRSEEKYRLLVENSLQGLAIIQDSRMEALRIAQEYAHEIHLVLTDVVMPGIGGRVLVSRLEKLRPGIKSLFVSGYTDNAIVHHGILDSDVSFLQKPFTVEGLTRKIRETLDS